MLTILGSPQRVCNGITRRELLQAGGAGLFGLTLPKVLAAEAAKPAARARAKSVMFLFLFGGPSQLESFDLKPAAPEGIRGPFKPIASRTPDLRVCEHLPRLAQMSDQFCVIRTVNHRHNDHNACHYIQTGHPWPRVAANGQDVNATDKDWPAMGSVIEYLDQRGGRRDFPSYIYLPNRLGHIQGYDRTGQYAGWLGRAYNPLATEIRKRGRDDNPYYRDCTDQELDFRIHGLSADPALTLDRLDRRRSLLAQFEQGRRNLDADRVATFDRIRRRALDLVTSEKMRTALDIRREAPPLRDRYGRHLFGQAALMGRRMIEAGARFVTVLWDAPDGYGWDSHIHSRDVEKNLLPRLDQTLPALLTDLKVRGLLDETLVVAVAEMGRSPKPATSQWGRNHWSFCYPAVLAGAGIRGGIVYGRSDKDAGFPIDRPVSPEDLAATIFDALGIDPHSFLRDKQDRPVAMVDGGRPLRELFG